MPTPAATGSTQMLVSPPVINPPTVPGRIASIDVYRGFVMFLMMAEVLSIHRVSTALPDSSFWSFMAFHQSHVEWVGCSLHDVIQPSFTFLVGVVLPYSMGARVSQGASFPRLLRHTIIRSLILIFLGIFLRSMHSKQTNFTFEDTLTQIGLGYTFLFLISYCRKSIQVLILFLILLGYYLAFALYPLPGPNFDYALTGVTADWPHNLEGFQRHWNKDTNLAWAFDRWFLNLFPRERPFEFNSGGYATLSFIPTLGTMILGLFAGHIMRSGAKSMNKVRQLVAWGIGLVVLALLLQIVGINPIVKRIWTPSWTLFSGGLCYLLLAFFYLVVDIAETKKWFLIFTVIGVNSIAAYVIADGFAPFISSSLFIHLGADFDKIFGLPYTSLVKGILVLIIEWLILYWMFRKRIFIKV